MEDGENRISFIKGIEITDGKADALYSALSNEIEKCGVVESFSGFGCDRSSVIIKHKKIASKLKRDSPKIISIHCDNHRLVSAIFPFFKENTPPSSPQVGTYFRYSGDVTNPGT